MRRNILREKLNNNEFSCVCSCSDPRCETCPLLLLPPHGHVARRPPPHARPCRTSRAEVKSSCERAALGAHVSRRGVAAGRATKRAGRAPETCVESVGGGGARLSGCARGHVLRLRGAMRRCRETRADVAFLCQLYIVLFLAVYSP